MLALLDLCDAEYGSSGRELGRKVLGVDIGIRESNRIGIEARPMTSRNEMHEGSSIAPQIIGKVSALANECDRIIVCLGSIHAHGHVLVELQVFAPLVAEGGCCVVFGTVIELMPANAFLVRPWGGGGSPVIAVLEYLGASPRHRIDGDIHGKFLIAVALDGCPQRIAS
ncbi:hypothetical protein CKO51_25865 [Rhodopirellula sp. SM50]|nr:hypothetical protein CKO51_25865 [Rhodopirellula sp. SM50]